MQYKVKRFGNRTETLIIDETRRLGRGATANVYRAKFDGKEFAAKIYHAGRAFNESKFQAMLASPPQNCEVIQNGQEYPQFAWPQFLILDNNDNEVGFLMPLVDANESFTLDYYYDPGLFKKLRSHDESALSYKLEIAKNLSLLVADLHRQGHFIIDCKPQNIRVFRRNHVVTLIDCDGFSVNGTGKRFPAELLSTDYIAPEAQKLNLSPSVLDETQDRYALAVILFQLLNRGTHPFQGIITDNTISANTNDEKAALKLYPHGLFPNIWIKPRPQSTHHLWPTETRVLFDKAFISLSPLSRPSANDWAMHFDSILKTKTLVRCEKFPEDVEHIRFRDLGCPACYLKSLESIPTLNQRPSKSSENTARLHPQPTQTLQSTYKPPPQPKSPFSAGWGILLVCIIVLFIWLVSNTAENRPTQPSSSSTTRSSLSANVQSPPVSPIEPTTASIQSDAQLPILGDDLKAGLRWPLIGTVTAHYGASRPEGGVWKGILIKASDGLPIAAVGDGTVVYADWLRGFGNVLIVKHGEQYLSVYGYNQKLLKRFGDSVKAGDIVALAGRTGTQVDPALYFEIRYRGTPMDPLEILSRSTEVTQPATRSIGVTPAAPITDKLVQDIQNALNQKGFNAGLADGVMGPQTQTAIIAAQRTLGLDANGIPSEALLSALKAKPSQDSRSVGGYGAQVRECIQPGVAFPTPPRSGSSQQASVHRVQLLPDGTISGVILIRSSGNSNFDRSVETGIRRCTPFPRPPSGSYPGYIDVSYNMYD